MHKIAFFAILSILFNSWSSNICEIRYLLDSMAGWSVQIQNHCIPRNLPTKVSCLYSTSLSSQVPVCPHLPWEHLSWCRRSVPPLDGYWVGSTQTVAHFFLCQVCTHLACTLSPSITNYSWRVPPLTPVCPRVYMVLSFFLMYFKYLRFERIILLDTNFHHY